MKKSVTTFFLIALSAAVLGAGNDGGNARSTPSGETNTFIETYDDGTDVGLWHCSVNVPRILEPSGVTREPTSSRAASAATYRHGPASRHVFNPGLTTLTRSIVSIPAIGPPSAL